MIKDFYLQCTDYVDINDITVFLSYKLAGRMLRSKSLQHYLHREESKMSRLSRRLDSDKKTVRDLTPHQWYWYALGFVRNCNRFSKALISQPCVCKCCGDKHVKKTEVKIHGDHNRAIQVARTLFYMGRPGIKAEEINEVEVWSFPGREVTNITRLEDGEIYVGYTMRCGTMDELVECGFLRDGSKVRE